MKTIRKDDKGAAVDDVQQRLASLGHLTEDDITGVFDDKTADAVRAFCASEGIDETDEVTSKVWAKLVDETYALGDRTLFLRMPYFHGNDVRELQTALAALGFACGPMDGIFGVYTELALRKFQMNMGLPNDGIAGGFTYSAIHRLEHSWVGKEVTPDSNYLGFARVADVLESNEICLFGTNEFTRLVASRMSNLALATNPAGRVVSAETLLVPPDESMYLVHIVLPDEDTPQKMPRVLYSDVADELQRRLNTAFSAADRAKSKKFAIELPGTVWMESKEERSAQHYAITLLDNLCAVLAMREAQKSSKSKR